MGWLDDAERRCLLAKKRVVDHPYDDAEYATDLVLGTEAPRLIALCRQLGTALIEACDADWEDPDIDHTILTRMDAALIAYREATT